MREEEDSPEVEDRRGRKRDKKKIHQRQKMGEDEDTSEVEDERDGGSGRCCKGRRQDKRKILQRQKMREQEDILEVENGRGRRCCRGR